MVQRGETRKSRFQFASKARRLPPSPSKATPVKRSRPQPKLPECALPSHGMPLSFKHFACAFNRSVHGFATGRNLHSGVTGLSRGRRGEGGTNASGANTRGGTGESEFGRVGTRGTLRSDGKLRSLIGPWTGYGAKCCTSLGLARYPEGFGGRRVFWVCEGLGPDRGRNSGWRVTEN